MRGTPVSDDQNSAPRSEDAESTTPGAPEATTPAAPPVPRSEDAESTTPGASEATTPAAPPVPPAPASSASSGAPSSDAPAAPPYGAPAAPAYGQAPASPPLPGAAYGAAPHGSGPYTGAPYAAGGYAPAVRTNVLSIISLVASIAGFLWILPVIGPIAAVITGHISLAQIRRTGENGRGMALAGTIVGWVGIAVILLFFIVLFVGLSIAASNSSRYGA